mmetsp:Transcript_15140/g.21129  ORF Transcript_15140/g.21129 Transcript_15140/m.21129 type:complete len:333 (+) Transcript_15140:198-1196(+)
MESKNERDLELIKTLEQHVLKSYFIPTDSLRAQILRNNQEIQQFVDVFYRLPTISLKYWFKCRIYPSGKKQWSLKIIQRDSEIVENMINKEANPNILEYKEEDSPNKILALLNEAFPDNAHKALEGFCSNPLAVLTTTRIKSKYEGFDAVLDCVSFDDETFYEICTFALASPSFSDSKVDSMRKQVKLLQKTPALSKIFAYLAWQLHMNLPTEFSAFSTTDSCQHLFSLDAWKIDRRLLRLLAACDIQLDVLNTSRMLLSEISRSGLCLPGISHSDDGARVSLEWPQFDTLVVVEEDTLIWVYHSKTKQSWDFEDMKEAVSIIASIVPKKAT